tara:strand:- start:1946 stop:2200 length:255 start_codon:yes stop_codon:yes gene_type:complete
MDSIEWILNKKIDKIPYKFSKLKKHNLEEYMMAETILESNLGWIKYKIKPLTKRIKEYEGTLENKREYVLDLINLYIKNLINSK